MLTKSSLRRQFSSCVLATIVFTLAGCQSNKEQPVNQPVAKAPPAPEAAPAVVATKPVPAPEITAAPAAEMKPAVPAAAAAMTAPIRIDAGSSVAHTNANGAVWLADAGFEGGDAIERASDLQIANTDMPEIYRSEHHSMTAFSMKVPNGKYTVKLHFAETFHSITAPGGRVFSFNVEGHDLKDFDVFAKAGGANRAYVETVNVEVTDGKLDITFKGTVQNPEINGIEIIPKFVIVAVEIGRPEDNQRVRSRVAFAVSE